MARVKLGVAAPDFELQDFHGTPVRLPDFHGVRRVLLVFNRGFT
jgi:peroxiredoxin